MEAIYRLRSGPHGIPDYALRFLDLVEFLYQITEISLAECNDIRQRLVQRGEHVPECFQGASFDDGLIEFFPRLLDATETK